MRGSVLASTIVMAWHCGIALAAEKGVIEEIIVTAQRIEENASKVPIAVNAFTEMGIEDRHIVGIDGL